MAPEEPASNAVQPASRERDTLRGRDWAVAIGLGMVLLLIIAAIFRNGLAYLYG